MGESVWNVSVGCVRTTLRSVGAPGNSRSGRSNSRPKSCTIPKHNDNNDLLCLEYKAVSAKFMK